MKKKIIFSILLLLTGGIAFFWGTIVYKKNCILSTGSLVNMYTRQDSHEVLMKAILLEGLHEGNLDRVKQALYIDIKTKLKYKDRSYDDLLDEDTIKAMNEDHIKTEKILNKYPDPTLSD